MRLTARISVVLALAGLLGTATGCNKLKSRDRINKGVAAFKNAQYEEAVSDFQEAVQLDPESDTAKLYLATSYAYQVVPNLMDPGNLALAQKALDGFNSVLAKNPNDLTALKQIASIDRNIGKLDQAKADELKLISVAPNDPEAYYTLGAIDFHTIHYLNAVPILAADGLIDDGQGNKKMTKGACAKMKAINTAPVAEALQYLNKALAVEPTYEQAMEYLQLVYREKANVDCGDEAARKADLAQADIWVSKAMDMRKQLEQQKEKKEGGGVTM
ncbi:MAG: tetratricopeptide repeat protein [Acidobacteriaceae bacterium]|jgi:tetratricopeptide (TPR) repeat protein